MTANAASQPPIDAATVRPGPRPRRRSTATDLALIATFAALIAVCSIVPGFSLGPAPITLQTFAVILCGAVLGASRGFLAVLLYLAVGAIGLPVFTGGAAGLAPFAGPTVGYLVAFPLVAWITGFLVERLPRGKAASSVPLIFLAGVIANVLSIHLLGPLGLAWRADMPVGAAFIFDLAFWPGDLLKTLLVAVVATAVHRAFPALLPSRRRPAASRTTTARPGAAPTE
ncbi:biotin transport system substrate-specific component [Leucobacter exalbidus]|uniref:Biotin transport system substrate-specific component n=1 Tax=Leucobacter exalbidus TaxID=662960 RepID=A0A940PSC8_9MICO|nr:biotin transporter BioY [Leucobacter exalbidus]MBP1326629.1 biotin transport system substrate-specific component [Leucobacter exalbidus]